MPALTALTSIVVLLSASFGVIKAVQANDPWQHFDTQTKASFRGLAAVSKDVAWACGSKGTVVQTRDGGKSWIQLTLPSVQETEIRSIHAWDGDKAIVATAGQPALILKTTDRGVTWKTTYENKSPQAFFDGLKFWNSQSGIAFSDPVDGCLLIVTTNNGGDSWKAIDSSLIPQIDSGEAGFAASNSSLHAFGSQLAWIGLGGGNEGTSRIFRTQNGGSQWTAHPVPSIARGVSSGIFSIAFQDELTGIAVGGDYNKLTVNSHNIAITEDGGLNWRAPRAARPRGFRSCVVRHRKESKGVWMACGPSGCDSSEDGEKWTAMSDIGFHVMDIAPDGSLWAAGSEGRVAQCRAGVSTVQE